MSISLFQSGTVWAEWHGRFMKNPTDKSYNSEVTPAIPVWHPHNADFHTQGESLTVHAPGWDETLEIYQFRSEFSKHGHNWYMTSRLDFWLKPEFDPFEWHGYLITGGYNSTFKVRRSIQKNAFTGWDRRKFPPTSVLFVPGALPMWRATFAKGLDRWVCQSPSGWLVGKSADECHRLFVLQRLNLAAA